MKTAAPAITVKRTSPPVANNSLPKSKAAPPSSGVGFLLLDCSLDLVSSNAEAARIFGYPNDIERLASSGALLAEEIRSRLTTMSADGQSVFATEFRSGGRRYFCRAFVIDARAKHPSQPNIAILLERGPSGLVPLSQIRQQFNFTQREQEVLEYLLQGMSSKEIAGRMNVSPNTVKAFLRLIMIKTGVSSRPGIVGKILMTGQQVLIR